MRILAIDCSAGAASACVLDEGATEPLARRSEIMARGHAEALAPMVEAMMGEVEGGLGSLGRIACAVGPGSFTGIRIGLALARAMGLALGIPVVGVSTLAALAASIVSPERSDLIAAAVDARHGRVYFQLFDASGRPLLPPRLEAPREAAQALGAGPIRLIGDGARQIAQANRATRGLQLTDGPDFPDIFAVARLGLAANPADHPPSPLYLKAPDAIASGGGVARVGP